jgi:hypothetical protein
MMQSIVVVITIMIIDYILRNDLSLEYIFPLFYATSTKFQIRSDS